MNDFRFELNTKGVGELLHSSEMDNVLKGYANQISSRAGDGYEVIRMPTRDIAVSVSSKNAKKDNLKNNTLLKSLRG